MGNPGRLLTDGIPVGGRIVRAAGGQVIVTGVSTVWSTAGGGAKGRVECAVTDGGGGGGEEVGGGGPCFLLELRR